MSIKPSLFLLALLAGCATAADPAPAGETEIPFVKSQGVIEWVPAGEDALYVRGSGGKWYLVRTMSPCPRLRTAQGLGFETGGVDQLDRYGAIHAEGWRCSIGSITRSEGPPERPDKD